MMITTLLKITVLNSRTVLASKWSLWRKQFILVKTLVSVLDSRVTHLLDPCSAGPVRETDVTITTNNLVTETFQTIASHKNTQEKENYYLPHFVFSFHWPQPVGQILFSDEAFCL